LKALRLIFILLAILAISSCRNGELTEQLEKAKLSSEQLDAPEWAPVQEPDEIYTYQAKQEELHPETEESSIILPKPNTVIKRDTIDGIVVRTAEKIVIPEYVYSVEGREESEQAVFNVGYISTNRYVGINFDNDIFNNTDYYYTNGIRLDYVSPIFASSPFAYPMLPYRKLSMNYHGMTVVQNMYTPTNPDTVMLLVGDRPFAAYLYLGHFKNTLSIEKHYRQYSELQIGLIGPGSLGGFVQAQIHEIPPSGWENQIQTDLVLNYTAEVEKGIYNPGVFDLNMFARGQLGTLYSNAGAGLRIRAGQMNPYFSIPWLASNSSKEGEEGKIWQYGIFATAYLKGILYDATLQGGVFNNTSNYTIAAEEIERLVLQASAGIFFSYRQIGLMYEQFYISPEFKGALHHRWGHINMTYCF